MGSAPYNSLTLQLSFNSLAQGPPFLYCSLLDRALGKCGKPSLQKLTFSNS